MLDLSKRANDLGTENAFVVLAEVNGLLAKGEDMPVIVQADVASQSGLLVRIIYEAKLGGATKVSVAARNTKG